MRALVIGGSGQIGGWILRHLAARGHEAVGTYATVPQPGLEPLDASDTEAAASLVSKVRPEVVFYPAGFTWVDECERDPKRCRDANVEQPLTLARLAEERGGRFVYFSTDYVFNGNAGPYDETATPAPLSFYGQHKFDAEKILTGVLSDLPPLILRTTWVYGPERQGKNFAYQLVRNLRAGKPVVLPSDQISSPSYGPDVALAAVELAEQGASGLYHVSNPDAMDRITFAKAVATAFGLDPSVIGGQPTAAMNQAAARPLSSGLLCPRLADACPGLMRPLDACLADFLARLDAGEGWADPRV
jgi:dTDP-4-dehydrorhamnose reductase